MNRQQAVADCMSWQRYFVKATKFHHPAARLSAPQPWSLRVSLLPTSESLWLRLRDYRWTRVQAAPTSAAACSSLPRMPAAVPQPHMCAMCSRTAKPSGLTRAWICAGPRMQLTSTTTRTTA